MQMRTCNDCGRTLPEDQFAKNGRWYRNQCLECKRAYNRKDYGAHRETRIAQVQRWVKAHPEHRSAYAKAHYEQTKPRHRVNAANRRNRVRAEVFQAYGGKCKCCGESEPMFLTIDHIDGGGNKHRKEVPGKFNRAGMATYEWLRKNGYPKGFRVLCYNCNIGTHRNKGICPHKARPKE